MIVIVRLGPEILFALEMKGQGLHLTRAHLNVGIVSKETGAASVGN